MASQIAIHPNALNASSAPSAGARRVRILQIFSRYLSYGGEEGSVYRIGDALQDVTDVEYFFDSSHSLDRSSAWSTLVAAGKAWNNREARRKLRRLQRVGSFDFWQIHNVFPALSPGVYEEAFEMRIPILHFLHNYRMSCVNGMFLNHGAPCHACIGGNFATALATGCWHDSRLQSGYMGAVMTRVRWIGVLKRINRWVAISAAQKRLHVAMGIPEDRIDVLHHFHEPTAPPPPFPESPGVAYFGRLSAEKGVDYLLRAWGRLRLKDVPFRIAGDGPERPRLEELVRKEGLRNVEFLGFLKGSEARRVWEKTSLAVIPSIWEEPFGMVALEAFAHARPVVAFASGGLTEIVTDRVNGLLVQPRSEEKLAEAIAEWTADHATAQAAGREGHRVLLEQFTREQWVRRIKRIYRSMLET